MTEQTEKTIRQNKGVAIKKILLTFAALLSTYSVFAADIPFSDPAEEAEYKKFLEEFGQMKDDKFWQDIEKKRQEQMEYEKWLRELEEKKKQQKGN